MFFCRKVVSVFMALKFKTEKAGVGLRFVRDLEQGKITLSMDKVNQVLMLFGQELGTRPLDRNKLIWK
ncbi:MAG: hypothetical protein WCS03_03060 [Bacteroidota bacterium]